VWVIRPSSARQHDACVWQIPDPGCLRIGLRERLRHADRGRDLTVAAARRVFEGKGNGLGAYMIAISLRAAPPQPCATNFANCAN
jgi:hypothetical protein